jgi:catechol 2,3-dioxygenase-like lactoylglutathione lyase family enzyme
MPVQLNHTMVHAKDRVASANFYSEILGLAAPRPFGPFMVVDTANGVSLDFISANEDEIIIEHYAFLVSEPEFDEIFGRIKERNLDYWADPAGRRKGEINRHDGGRGVYWRDPNGHYLEIIIRPYGSGGLIDFSGSPPHIPPIQRRPRT